MSSKSIQAHIASPINLKKNQDQIKNSNSLPNLERINSLHNQKFSISSRSQRRIFQFSKGPNDNKSWKVGKYYTNSGIYNANIARTSSYSSLASNTTRSDSKISLPTQRPFYPNKESMEGWDPAIKKTSMINYQYSDYNPITLASVPARTPTANSHRQGVFCEYIDLCKLNNKRLDTAYQDTLKANPRAFYKKSGEFTEHNVNCIKLGGVGPFFTSPKST
ncbi:unnamed protein product [Blepharisma stoltei]|uniref:Uncharacterized protein n=1 Tax=Blepharisma stoltei TaxID=1481888 RepID=A0AAU9IJ87_9CILI|nr:unnamed protein product [Blepharisma stoltei]